MPSLDLRFPAVQNEFCSGLPMEMALESTAVRVARLTLDDAAQARDYSPE